MKKLLLTFGIAVVASLTSIAQIGIIDPNFNLGTGFGPDRWTGKCETVIQQSDGKLLVGGQFKTFNGNPAYYIARLNLNGTVDNSFTSPFDDSWGAVVSQIKRLPDGKILVCGGFLKSNNTVLPGIVRLNSNGTLDQNFTAPSSVTQVSTFDVQSDGKIILGNLIRLNADGTQDNSFNAGTGISGGTGFGGVRVNKLIVQPDGKILIGGHFGSYNGNSSLLLARLNSDGTIDGAFNANANFSPAVDGFYGQIYSIKLLPNGKIMTGGNYGNNNSLAFGVDRLNSDGSLDTSFAITHSFSNIRNYVIDVQSDGRVFVANQNFGAPSEAFVVERYNTDGSLDTIFPKKYVNNDIKDLITQADGNITFVGYFNYNPTGIMRLIGDTPLSTSITENTSFQFNVFPNPTNRILNIENIPNNSHIRVIDIFGRNILFHKSSEKTFALDVSTLIDGTYFLQIEHNGDVTNKKILISK
jgi:uncharacterized delta-60 repeat protein